MRNAICVTVIPRLVLASQLSDRFYKSLPFAYRNATFSTFREVNKQFLKEGDNANKKMFSSTNREKWIQYITDDVLSLDMPEIWWVTYDSLYNFYRMLKQVKDNNPNLWQDLEPRLHRAMYDEFHNLSTMETFFHTTDEKKKSQRKYKTLHEALPFLNKAFSKVYYLSATVPEFVIQHPELFGEVLISIPQSRLQEEGLTIPVIPTVIDLAEINDASTTDELDIAYFAKCIDDQLEIYNGSVIPPKVIIWSRHAYNAGSHVHELRKRYPGCKIYSLVADTPKEERDRIFDEFENSTVPVFIINYDILGEGINVDGVTASIIGRIVGEIKIVQISGRPGRMYVIDRRELESGNIEVGISDGWIKPEGIVYLAIDTNDHDSREQTIKSAEMIAEMHKEGYFKRYDEVRQVGMPKGKPVDSDPNVFQPDLPDITLKEEYVKQMEVMNLNELRKKLMKHTNAEDFGTKMMEVA